MAEDYKDQYCEKHDQYYGKHLHQCPICRGENTGPAYIKEEKTMEDKGV